MAHVLTRSLKTASVQVCTCCNARHAPEPGGWLGLDCWDFRKTEAGHIWNLMTTRICNFARKWVLPGQQRRLCPTLHNRMLASPSLVVVSVIPLGLNPVTGERDDEDKTLWKFGFQVNERYLPWDDMAAMQLLTMVVAQKMHLEEKEVAVRLQELLHILPDLGGKMERMKADILVAMLGDLEGVMHKLLNLREQLPGVNVSSLAARWPYIILDYDIAALNARLALMREQLPGVQVELLIDEEPMLLKTEIPLVLQNMRRLLPHVDPVQVVVGAPRMVLDMTSAGMESAVDVEGIPPRAQSDDA